MQGYEKYVSQMSQNRYDNDEWNNAIKEMLVETDIPVRENFEIATRNIKIWGEMLDGYIWSNKCLYCSRHFICDGVQKEYADMFGTDELTPPVERDYINDPMHFRKEYSKEWTR